MAQLERVLAQPRNTVLLLCSPHNPTGKVWTHKELETMARLCEKHGVKVISDEIHMDMVWDEHQHTPWCEVARSPWALFTSGSKSFNIPAFTGAYGLIDDPAARESYLHALKARDLAWIDLRPLAVDDRALQKALIEEQKVAIMPGDTYGDEGKGFVRLNAGCPREKLEKGVQGLIAALGSLR